MKKKPTAKPPVSGVEQKDAVERLRRQGRSNKEIAEDLEISANMVAELISQLIKEGRTEDRRRRPKASWHDIADERTQTIITMLEQHATLSEIAAVIGVTTKERVRQLIQSIRNKHGNGVFRPAQRVWNPNQAAKKLKVSPSLIVELCRSGQIPVEKPAVRPYDHWLIGEVGMKVLRKHSTVKQERVCLECGTTFKHGGTNTVTCSDKCSHTRRAKQRYAEGEPESFVGWRRDLWEALQLHRIPEVEEWLPIGQAAQRTRLSQMQLLWLRRRKIVSVFLHPTKTWRGRPVMMFSASEMEIARQVYRKWQSRKRKKR